MESTSYGTWTNHGGGRYTTLADTVREAIGDPAGVDVDGVIAEYTAAINAALPDGVSLQGSGFYGPSAVPVDAFEGYPLDEDNRLDIAAIVADVDIWKIIEDNTN